jgi:hypothetical protein
MDWRKLERAADLAVLGSFSENVRLSFFKSAMPDPTRAAVEVRALLHVGGDDSPSSGSDGMRTRLVAGKAELFLDRSTYTGPTLRKDDKVRALDRTGQPWFMVASVSDRYTNLMVLSLYEA